MMARNVALVGAAGWLCAVTPAFAAPDPGRPVPIAVADAPAGFEVLLQEQDIVVDLVFGGRRLGQARMRSRPGGLKLENPEAVAALLPDVRDLGAVSAALAGYLDPHGALVCAATHEEGCGTLSPEVAGVIYDEDRFSLEIFVNPRHLEVRAASVAKTLPTPPRSLSLATSFAAALAGSSDSSPTYNLQNRTVIGLGPARLRSATSFSPGGLFVDDLFVEADRGSLRYSAGILQAPGIDFIGQRKILGLGVQTQFDTRVDKDLLRGNPLVVFFSRPSRLDIFRDGQLAISRTYEAGNQAIDTSALPDGSYELLLRIHEAGGQVREERRFLAKNARIAPLGETILFAFAGVLSSSRANHIVDISREIFFTAGIGRRVTDTIALDVTAIGTGKRLVFEAGATASTRVADIRAAALVSARGDTAALFQVNSTGLGIFGYNLDVRRVSSRDNTPLIPVTAPNVPAGSVVPVDAQFGAGSFTQASANVTLRVRRAQIGGLASYRRDTGRKATFTYGSTLYWPIASTENVQLALQAELTRSSSSTAAFLGLRVQFGRNQLAAVGMLGGASLTGRSDGERDRGRIVGQLDGTWQTDLAGGELSIGAGIERSIDSSAARAGLDAVTRFASASAHLLQGLETKSPLQYGLNVSTGIAATRHGASISGRELSESGIVASVGGSDHAASFEVLVDEVSRGIVKSGGSLAVFLPPYREYTVRIRPVSAAQMNIDSRERRISLYPGNVRALSWTVARIFTLFGRAVRPDGTPIPEASLTSSRGIGETDQQGYFQIQTAGSDRITLRQPDGTECELPVRDVKGTSDYIPVGSVVCR